MPDIRDNSTVEAIAQAFTSNGRVKSLALEAVGYQERYSRTVGLKLYDNIRLIEAIARIDGITEDKCDYSRESQLEKLQDIVSTTKNQPSAVVAAIRAQNSMLGYDQEKAPNEEAARQRAERMTDEDRAIAEMASNERVLALAREKGIKVVSDQQAERTA